MRMDFELLEELGVCLAILFVGSLSYYYLYKHKYANYPPGPRGLPFMGNLLALTNDPPSKITEWSKEFGKTITISLGWHKVVVINDFQTAKEVLFSENFTGREPDDIRNILLNKRGLVVSEGDLWREHRRFALTTLKAAGMGKAWLGDSLLVEVTEFVKWLAISGGMPINPRHQLTQSVSNVICALVFGKRFQLGNETFNKLCNNIGENLQLMSELQSTKSFPILKYIPLGKYYKARKTLLQKIKENQLFIQSLIKEHQEEFISGTEGSQDFIISFLREKEKQANNKNSTFDDAQLYYSVVGLFGGGTETTTTTLLWAMIFMIENPKVQEKVREEIESVVAWDQPVTMQHKGLLRYTEATILEVQRLASAVPLNGSNRVNYQEMTIDGYLIPAKSSIAVNLFAIHRDPQYWPEALQFKPERFIEPVTKLIRIPAGFMPFGIGQRFCIGESLAKMELFLFFSNIIKEFSLEVAKPFAFSSEKFSRSSLIIRSPQPFEISFRRRRSLHG